MIPLTNLNRPFPVVIVSRVVKLTPCMELNSVYHLPIILSNYDIAFVTPNNSPEDCEYDPFDARCMTLRPSYYATNINFKCIYILSYPCHDCFFHKLLKKAVPIVLIVVPRPFQKRPLKPAYRALPRCRKDSDRRDSVRNFEQVHVRVGSSASLSEPHTSCEMERFWALGHFILAKCTALVSVVAGSRRQCGMERALYTGVDWKMPPVSALQRDMDLRHPRRH